MGGGQLPNEGATAAEEEDQREVASFLRCPQRHVVLGSASLATDLELQKKDQNYFPFQFLLEKRKNGRRKPNAGRSGEKSQNSTPDPKEMSSSSELKRKRTASSGGEGTTQHSSSKKGTPEKQKAKKMKKATAGDNGLGTKQQQEASLPWAASGAGGFQLVPLPLKPHALAANEEEEEEKARRRYLYIRQHRAGSQVDDDPRGHHPTEEAGATSTLFVANVGDDADAGAVEDQLRRLFERCGHPVESVTLKSMRRVPPADSHRQQQQQQQRPAHQGGRGPWLEVAQADDAEARPLVFAHVTFSSPDGLRAALRYDWNSAAAAESDAAGEAAGSGRGVNSTPSRLSCIVRVLCICVYVYICVRACPCAG
jgi:hypothetical protein